MSLQLQGARSKSSARECAWPCWHRQVQDMPLPGVPGLDPACFSCRSPGSVGGEHRKLPEERSWFIPSRGVWLCEQGAGGVLEPCVFAPIVPWCRGTGTGRGGSGVHPMLLKHKKPPQLLVGACQPYHRSTDKVF